MTAHVLFRDVSFRHSSAVDVLRSINLEFGPGWTGVVGANGVGKSTLLRLASGDLRPDAGSVQVSAGVPPVLCSQEVDDPSPAILALAQDWTSQAARWRSRLDLDPDGLDRWPSLSPGERKRWQIAAALVAEPDVLLLDEPTTHLDAASIEVLVAALQAHRGVGIVVSHDRHLLDTLTTRTVRLVGPTQVEPRPGGYSSALQQWEADEAHQESVESAARREERRLRQVRADVQRRRSQLETAAAAIRRSAGTNQPDAREAGRRIAAAKAEAAVARRVRQLNARVDRAEGAGGRVNRGQVGGDVAVRHAGGRRRWLARLQCEEVRAGDVLVLRDVDVAVSAGDRIHVAGDNGAGKSTLLRHLVAPVEGIGVLTQEHSASQRAGLLAWLRGLDAVQRGRVLGTVALLGVDPDRLLATDVPSPGEARKLDLARLLVGEHDLIVLDEPTNHLDVPAIQRLESALVDFPGALLLVTHDAALARSTTSTTWCVGDGYVRVDGTRRGSPTGRRVSTT